jgi:hypothetical protein
MYIKQTLLYVTIILIASIWITYDLIKSKKEREGDNE